VKVTLPAVRDGDDAGAVLGNFEEHGHGEVEVWSGRVAPSAIVAGESVVRRAEVRGRHQDRGAASVAPARVVVALYLEARSAAQPAVEQRRAQRRRVHAVALAVEVPVPARASHCAGRVAPAVERGVRALPRAAAVNSRDSGLGGSEKNGYEGNNGNDFSDRSHC